MDIFNYLLLGLSLFCTDVLAVPYGGGASINWNLPSGQFTYITSTFTVPSPLTLDPSQGFYFGKLYTQLQEDSVTIGNSAVDDSGSGTTGQRFLEYNSLTVYTGDEVKATYQKDMSNVTYGAWTLKVDVKRGPAGVAAGASAFSDTSSYNGMFGGNQYDTMFPIASIGSFVYQGAWVTRRISVKNITLKSTNTNAAGWCTAGYGVYQSPGGASARGWIFTNGPVATNIAGGSECSLGGLSWKDPPDSF